eukprot:SAG31_NODE_730_length_12505_cov_3.807109_1_plen_483_part_10
MPACLPGRSYPDPAMPGTAICPPWSDSKHCSEHVRDDPSFCERANEGPQPNCCHECNFPWKQRFPNVSRSGCQNRSHAHGPATLTCTCLDQQRLDALLDFSRATGVSLVFGLTIAADVNSAHTLALLKYIHDADSTQQLYGYEYGNEQEATLPERTQATQFARLQKILATLYSDKPRVPVLIGPDTNGFGDALTFLKQAQELGVSMHGVTYHEYTTSVQGMRVESLAKMREATNSSTEQLWVGEAGGAAGGGRPGLTDSYASGLWWLPALGEKALSGHSVYCRQDLVGGDYGLLHDNHPWNVATVDTATAEQAVLTRPDYWTALLFKRLMGDGVLATTTTYTHPSRDSGEAVDWTAAESLLSYCHCSRRFDGGLALLLVNPTNAITTVEIRFAAARGPQWNAIGYNLSAGTNATTIQLNKRSLFVTKQRDGGWLMPDLDGINISGTAAQLIIVDKQSYLFLEYPNAGVATCAGSHSWADLEP